MIRIVEVGSYIPSRRESNRAKMSQFGISADFITEKIGVEAVSRMEDGEDTGDLCIKAFADLEARIGRDLDDIECLVVCTQNPHALGIPHTSAVVHGMLDLSPMCACFDISLGCSGYVYGLSVLQGFMRENGFTRGVLITADPYSKIVDPDDKSTVLLFGDAATATLLEAGDGPGWIAGPFVFGTVGKEGSALTNIEGKLRMNGLAVFRYSSLTVPSQIKALLVKCGRSMEEIDLFLLHQGSRVIIDEICRSLSLSAERVPMRLSEFGNTVSSSLPLLLQPLLREMGEKSMVLSGFGVGLSAASCLLTPSSSGPTVGACQV